MQKEAIIQTVQSLYEHNAFMQHCGIQIKSIGCGKAAVGLKVDADIHTNLNGRLHGGLLMTLVDNATGIACATVGKKVVTVSTTVSFIKGASANALVEAQAEIISQQGGIFTVQVQVYNTTNNQLLATSSSTMLEIATFPNIPEQW